MLKHEDKPDLTLIQTLGQMLNEVGYQLKLSSEIRTQLIHATRKAWKGSLEELALKVNLDVDDDARVITLVDGTQLDLEVEFVLLGLNNPYGTFEMLDTTVFHGELWSGIMIEPHEDVGDEITTLIEKLAASHYHCSAR